MVQTISETDQERREMYNGCSKEHLIDLLLETHRVIESMQTKLLRNVTIELQPPPTDILDYAHSIGGRLSLKKSGPGQWMCCFADAEIKDNDVLKSSGELGCTKDEAIYNYAKSISGKTLVLYYHDDITLQYGVPSLTYKRFTTKQ